MLKAILFALQSSKEINFHVSWIFNAKIVVSELNAKKLLSWNTMYLYLQIRNLLAKNEWSIA